MAKLKEKLLNNLSEEEMNDKFEISAFEYVEYMENYKNLFDDEGNLIPEDVAEQLSNEKEKLESEYFEQSAIDDINDSLVLKYTDNDILYVLRYFGLEGYNELILGKLNEVWNTKRGLF